MNADFKDFLEFREYANQKNYSQLESGSGYITLDSDNQPTCALHTDEPVRFIALLQFKRNIPRGNHYHIKKVEHMIILSGKVKCIFTWPPKHKNKSTYECILGAGQMVIIQPGVVHTFTALNDHCTALEASPQIFKTQDTVQVG